MMTTTMKRKVMNLMVLNNWTEQLFLTVSMDLRMSQSSLKSKSVLNSMSYLRLVHCWARR